MASEEDAFLAAFREHRDGLFRHAFFRLGSRERALDLSQDAFMKAWDYVRAGGAVKNYKPFMYRTLNNLVVDEYRRKKMESMDAMTDERRAMVEMELAEGSVIELEESLDEKNLMDKVKGALVQLSPEYRTAVTMRFVDGFSPKEIAQMIGVTENLVSVRINRGVEKLRTMLAYEN
jgi:RNA polymerase sigma-70 factor (ECF subfamily)